MFEMQNQLPLRKLRKKRRFSKTEKQVLCLLFAYLLWRRLMRGMRPSRRQLDFGPKFSDPCKFIALSHMLRNFPRKMCLETGISSSIFLGVITWLQWPCRKSFLWLPRDRKETPLSVLARILNPGSRERNTTVQITVNDMARLPTRSKAAKTNCKLDLLNIGGYYIWARKTGTKSIIHHISIVSFQTELRHFRRLLLLFEQVR